MLQNSGFNIFPLFPDWVFEHNMPIEKPLVDDIESLPKKVKEEYGWSTKNNILSKDLDNLRLIMGRTFIQRAKDHFKIALPDDRHIQVCNTQVYAINPGEVLVPRSEKLWYTGVCMLNTVDSKGLRLYAGIQKNITTPVIIQSCEYNFKSNINDVVFFPGHISWGIPKNTSNETRYILVSRYAVKKMGDP